MKERFTIPCREIASGRLDFSYHLSHADSRCTCHYQAIGSFSQSQTCEISLVTSMMCMIRVSTHGRRQPFNRITDQIFWP
ncbi:hypothetical protein PILCRDRAFT_630215 [Piloderma croceum F 1598]|uniref:Uncharacterized protein n=1 Tax=Piloderma croceum (strain F 1598) TaxID=765440 RepID=A0A0C3EWW6_PILCF|nr:hypothetical protein PILCRDRAFT_630215 [Piloderma croceum F 1598]